MKTRRDALRTLAAAAGAVPALDAQQHAHSEPLVQIPKPSSPTFFTAAEFQLVTRVADLIIPRTETPGAADVGVPFAIDRAASRNSRTGQMLRDGLGQLNASGFAEKSLAEQTAVLQHLHDSQSPFFETMKTLTVEGYYATREGLVNELGWHGNTYLASFEGCTHPEHQVSNAD